MITNAKRYKVLKEILTVKNPRWLKPGEEFKATTSSPRVRALLEHGYIEEIPEKPKTVNDLKEGDECWVVDTTCLFSTKVCWDKKYNPLRLIGLVALTERDCNKIVSRLISEQTLLSDTKGFKPNWKDVKQLKFSVYYDDSLQWLVVDQYCYGIVCFESLEDATASIKAHPTEWKIYLGVER